MKIRQTIVDLDRAELQGEALLEPQSPTPTIDRYLDRSPKLNTDQDYEQMVRVLQRKRPLSYC